MGYAPILRLAETVGCHEKKEKKSIVNEIEYRRNKNWRLR